MSDVKNYDDNYYGSIGSTMTVIENDRASIVTFRNEKGSKFRVLVRQKPNPIGFVTNFGRRSK